MNRPELLEGSPIQSNLDLASQHQEAASQSNIYRIAWQRKSLLILGLILAIVIGILYYSQKEPVYQSFAMISVVRKNQPLSSLDGRSAYNSQDDYLTLHAIMLKTASILAPVAQDNDIKKLETFLGKNPGEIIMILATGLNVTRDTINRSPVLNISFKGPIANDCQTIITAVIKHYKDYLKDNYHNETANYLQSIRRAQLSITEEAAKLSKQHLEYLEQNPAITRNTAAENPMYARLKMLESGRIRIMDLKLDVESRMTTLKKGVQMGGYGKALLGLLPNSGMIRPGGDAALGTPIVLSHAGRGIEMVWSLRR